MNIILFIIVCIIFAILVYFAKKEKVKTAVIVISSVLMLLQFLALRGNNWEINPLEYEPISFYIGFFIYSIIAIVILTVAILKDTDEEN